jgi:hypothetical protein
MTAARLNPRVPLLRFGLLVLAIYAVEVLAVRSRLFLRNPDLAAVAIAVDLVVCVPALF